MKGKAGRWMTVLFVVAAFLLTSCDSGSTGTEDAGTNGENLLTSVSDDILGCQPDVLMPTINEPLLYISANGSDAEGDLNDFFDQCVEGFGTVITSVTQLIFVKRSWLERSGYQEVAPGKWYYDMKSYGVNVTSFVGITDESDRWQIFKLTKGVDTNGNPIYLEVHAFVTKDCKGAGADIFVPEYAGSVTASFEPGVSGTLKVSIVNDLGGYSGVPGVVVMKQEGVILSYSMDNTWATLSGNLWDDDEKASAQLSIARELNPHRGRCEMFTQYNDVDQGWVTKFDGWIEWWMEDGNFHGKYDVQYLDKHYPPDDGTTGEW